MNNQNKRIVAIGVLIVIIVVGAAIWMKVNPNQPVLTKYTATSLDIFDTRTEILGYANDKDEFSKQAELIRERLVFYNKLYDIYNDYDGINNIKTINDNAGIQPVKVDEEILNLLDFSKEMYEKTDGRVNIAMGAVLRIWHEHREYGSDNPESATLPKLEELQAAAEHTDINNMIIDREAGTVYLSDPEMSLDVGSTGKGYAVQRVMDYAREQGLHNVLLSLGGNISCIDGRIDGTDFKLAIQNPDMNSDEEYIETVAIKDGQCVVSSGDYQRYYVVDGKVYCHIINPDTLFPADTFAAVSLITDDSGEADALSTAIYNMTFEEGMDYVNSRDDLEAMWVYHDGTKVYSEHFEEYIVE